MEVVLDVEEIPDKGENSDVEEDRDEGHSHRSKAAENKWRRYAEVRPEAEDEDEDEDMEEDKDDSDETESDLRKSTTSRESKPERGADRTESAVRKQQSGPLSDQCRHLQIQRDKSKIRFDTMEIAETDITSLFASLERELSVGSEWTLDLLIFPKKAVSKSILFSRYARRQLHKYWCIPKACFDAHERLWSGVMTYAPVACDDSWKGYLMRSDRSWGWACTLAISHNASSNTTYGVCIGLRPHEAQALVEYLEREKRYAGNSLFVPIALAELYIPTTITMNRRHNEDFYNIQTAMNTDDYIVSPKVRRALDLLEFASKLTALASSSAGVTQLCSTQDRIIQFLGDQLGLLKKEASEMDDVLTSFCERLAFIRELLQAERQHNEYIKAATQAQVQMVYSLTAQRDNEHSLNLARLSQKQNSINIQISQFAAYESRMSNKMAKTSLKYGLDMQVIAAVTLGFLPGTFIATLFSTSFWNFQAENRGRVVSKWVWLYWVLTVVLTLAVLAAWRIVSCVRTDGLELPPEWELGKLPEIDDSGEIEEKSPV